MRGFDLSHWNGEMGCRILRDSSVELDFVIAKHSEGATVKDTMHDRYKKLAEERGIIFEPYHFYVGNNFTEDRRLLLVNKFAEMAAGSTTGVIWLDWERELDRNNFEFIVSVINAYEELEGRAVVGLYASYSVLVGNTYCPKGCPKDMTLAEYCYAHDIPIWCARYKHRAYVQGIEYADNTILFNSMQSMIGDIPVDVNQIATKCQYKGQVIDLDYDVRFMTANL